MKKIGIISPSNNVNNLFPNRYDRTIKNIKKANLIIIKNPYKKNNNKIKEINYLIEKNADILISTIGGYSSIEIIDKLDYELIKKNNIRFCGFSDITALLLAVYSKTGLIQYYGPTTIVNFGERNGIDSYTKKYFLNAIDNKKVNYKPTIYIINEYYDWNELELKEKRRKKTYLDNHWLVKNKGIARGKLIGGNLVTMLLIIGTEFLPLNLFENALLFIEDCETNIKEFESFMNALKIRNILNIVNGIIFGKFDSIDMNNDFKIFVDNYFKDYNKPILYNVDFGHTFPIITIPIGAFGEINTIKCTFKIIEY